MSREVVLRRAARDRAGRLECGPNLKLVRGGADSAAPHPKVTVWRRKTEALKAGQAVS